MAAVAPPRRIARGLLSAAYLAAGVAHLTAPGGFIAITPAWVPAPATVIAMTGACEIAGAIGLLTRQFRWWAGVMLALYAVCVFPANVHQALADVPVGGVHWPLLYHVIRLPLQPVIVWWALYAGAVIDWPMKKGRPDDAGRPPLPVRTGFRRKSPQ